MKKFYYLFKNIQRSIDILEPSELVYPFINPSSHVADFRKALINGELEEGNKVISKLKEFSNFNNDLKDACDCLTSAWEDYKTNSNNMVEVLFFSNYFLAWYWETRFSYLEANVKDLDEDLVIKANNQICDINEHIEKMWNQMQENFEE